MLQNIVHCMVEYLILNQILDNFERMLTVTFFATIK
jgi:hypothetical protein